MRRLDLSMEVIDMSKFLEIAQKPRRHLVSVLETVGLSEFAQLETRVGYFGTGHQLHMFVGDPDSSIWVKACEGFRADGSPSTFNNEKMDENHMPGARANCWRCGKMLGLVEKKYPGKKARRQIELRGGPFAVLEK